MSQLEVDRLREKFPRSSKALVELYPIAWDDVLRVIEDAMEQGKTASVICGRLSILRGLERSTRRWVMLSIAADRREIMVRRQKSFLTQLHDKSLDDILAELNDLVAKRSDGGATPTPPNDNLPRGYAFISHHSASQGKVALELAEALEGMGGDCWVAPRNVRPGCTWNLEVYGAAQRCGVAVLLYSRKSAASAHVRGEINIIVGRGVPVLVVKMSEGDPAMIDIGLASYQHIDWLRPAARDVGELAKTLHKAIAEMRFDASRAA